MNWLWWTLLSAVCVALANITRKEGLKKEHALEFATTRALMASLMVIAFIPFVDFGIPFGIIALMVVVGFIAAFGRLFYSKAYRHMDVSSVAPMRNLGPFFLILLAVVFLKETFTVRQAGGVALLIVGAYILQADHHLGNIKAPFVKIWKSKYYHYVIFGIVVYSFTAMLDKLVMNRLQEAGHGANAQFTMMFFIWLSLSLTLSVMTAVKYGFVKDIKHAWHKGWLWIVLSAGFAFASALTYYKAISLAFVGIVIPVKRLSTLFETLIGGEIFHEKDIMLKVASCAIMIAGAVLVAI